MPDTHRPQAPVSATSPGVALSLLGLLLGLSLSASACGGPQGEDAAMQSGAASEEEPEGGYFEYERSEHDFGVVPPDSVKQTTFALVAAGEGDLVVETLVRSCGCTEGELFELVDGERRAVELGRAYSPGTRFELVATLNTKGKEGVQEQKVRIVLGGGDEMASFVLHAVIEPFLVAEPKILELGRFSTLEGSSGTVRLTSRSEEPIALSVERIGRHVEAEARPIEPDGDGRSARWELDVRVPRDVPPGTFAERLRWSTDVPNTEAHADAEGRHPPHHGDIWVRGVVEGPIAVLPDRVSFGNLPAGRPVSRSVFLNNLDPEFQMEQLEVRVEEGRLEGAPEDFLDAFHVAASEVEPGRRWKIEMTVEDPPRSGLVTGRLAVRVDHPVQEMVAVPFRMVVPAASN